MGTPKTRTSVGILSVLLGIWLFATPFLFGIESAGQWHLYFWGLVVAILGAYQASRAQTGRGPLTGASIGIVIVGLWIAASPLAYTYGTAALINVLIAGLILVVAGIYETGEANRLTRPSQA